MTRERLPAAVRRDRILDAADETFSRLGFEATRMDDVAEAAGVAKGLLYKHFASKDELFDAVLDREGAWFADALRESLLSADLSAGPQAALESGLALWIDESVREAPSYYFADPGIHPAYETTRARARAVIAEVVTAFEPASAPAYTQLIAAALQGAAENVATVWRANPMGLTTEDARAFLAQFCWGGLDLLQREFDPNADATA